MMRLSLAHVGAQEIMRITDSGALVREIQTSQNRILIRNDAWISLDLLNDGLGNICRDLVLLEDRA